MTYDPTAPLCLADRERLYDLRKVFDARDGKGRTFGAQFVIDRVEFYPASAGATWGRRVQPGTYFEGCPQSTRGGFKYGALQRATLYDTVEEALKAADAYFIGAEKRALNNKARR